MEKQKRKIKKEEEEGKAMIDDNRELEWVVRVRGAE